MKWRKTEKKKKKKKRLDKEALCERLKILKLLNYKDIYQSQMVCRRWKVIIDMGNLKKKATGKTSNLLLFSF